MPQGMARCRCALRDTPAVAFANTPAVFSGTVTRFDRGSALSQLFEPLREWLGLAPAPGANRLQAVVQVSTAWKGVRQSPVVVTTEGGARCGHPFESGQQYLIYAHEDGDGMLNVSLCSRTGDLSRARADRAFLQTQAPLPVTQGALAPGALRLGVCLAGLAAAAVALGAIRLRRSMR
jgi:hypothetical protein